MEIRSQVCPGSDGTGTLCDCPFNGNYAWTPPWRYPSRLQFGLVPDFQFELFPVHSQLLGESLLVSFPPLNYMLKFSPTDMLILKSSASERSVDSASRPRARFLPQLASQPLLSLRIRVCHPNTRIYVRLLGPCFQTGGRKPFRQHREPSNWSTLRSTHLLHRQNFVLSRARADRRKGPSFRAGYHPQSEPS